MIARIPGIALGALPGIETPSSASGGTKVHPVQSKGNGRGEKCSMISDYDTGRRRISNNNQSVVPLDPYSLG